MSTLATQTAHTSQLAELTHFVDMSKERRKVVGSKAANTYDAETLVSLTLARAELKSRSGKPLSARTRRLYERGARDFITYAQGNGVNLLHIESEKVVLWLRGLAADGASDATVAARLNGVRRLVDGLNWVTGDHVCPDLGVVRAPKMQAREETIKAYSAEEVKALLSYYELRPREQALVAVMAFAGLRISEALALTWQDVEFERMRLRIRQGKGGKAASVAIPSHLSEMLGRYKELSAGQPETKLFAMTDRNARGLIDRACKKLGFEPKGLHGFRHHCGVQYERHVGVKAAQKVLRHASVATTSVYTEYNDAEMIKAANAVFGAF